MIRINLIQSPSLEPEAKGAEAPARERRRALPALASTVVCFGLAGLLHWSASHRIAQYNQQIATERQEAGRLAAIKAQNGLLQTQIAEISEHINVIHALQARRTGPQELMTLLGGATDRLSGLYLLAVDTQKGRLDIRGQSSGVGVIADFINALQGMPWFDDVQLRQVFEDDQNRGTSFKFELECLYRPPAEADALPLPPASAASLRRQCRAAARTVNKVRE